MLKIMISDPETFHQGWRHAIQIIGKKVPFARIVQVMSNEFSSTNKNTHWKHHDLILFFHLQSGTLNQERFRPRLTDEHEEKRVTWCHMATSHLLLHFCFLDEKWFCFASRRKKEKIYLLHHLKAKMSVACLILVLDQDTTPLNLWSYALLLLLLHHLCLGFVKLEMAGKIARWEWLE